jgi:phage-related minor tail protein
MAPLATAFVEIRPESGNFKKDAERTFSDAGKSSGTMFSSSYTKETTGRLRNAQGQFIKAHEQGGRESGKIFGKRFSEETQRSGGGAGKETGKRFGAGFAGAMGGVAVLAAQALGPALAEALDLGAVKGKLTAELGLTQSESSRIGGVAGKLYAQAYGDSMGDVQTAIASVIQNMDGLRSASSASLQDTTAKAITLSQVMGEDVGAVTRTVSQLLRTGMAKNAQQAFDILTKGAQQGANKSQDLLDTFNEYPTQFRKLGLSGQQAMGLITQGLKNGARDSDLVADALKEFSIRAVDGSKLTAQGFKALGLSGKQMASDIAAGGPKASGALDLVLQRLRGIQDPVKRSQAAVALFGTQAEDLGQALYSLDPSKATKALGGLSGATDKAGKALGDTAQAKFTAFKRSIQTNIVNGLVGYAIPAITGAFSTLQATVGPFFTWLTGSSTAASILRGALFGLVAAMVAIKIATSAWAVVQAILNAELIANPIGLIIIAIAALVGGIILAYKHSQTFRDIVQATWHGIQTAINIAWTYVIKPVFEAIKFYIMKILVPYYKFLWSIAKIVWKGIQVAIQVAWFAIRVYWALLMLELRLIWKAFQFLWSIVRPLWQALGRLIQSIWTGFIRPAFNAIKSGLSATKSAFSTAISAIGSTWNKLKSITKGPVSFMVNTVYMGGIRKVWEGVRGLVPGLPDIPAVHFAAGGIFPGYTPGRDVYQMPMAAFSGGESVMVPEFTRAVGSGFVHTANKVGRRGGPMAVRSWLSGGQAFADGGILGRIKGILKKPLDLAAHAGNYILDKGADVFAKNILNPVLHHIPHGDDLWSRAIFSLPEKLIGGFLEFIKKTVAPSLGGGGDALGVVRAALKYVGQGDDRGRDNDNQFTRHWGWAPGTPWCALFVSTAIQDAHAQKHYRGFPTAAAAGYNSMRNVGLGEGRAGDLATYHGDGHINIIEKAAKGGGYWTIGGNQNSKVQHSIRGSQGRILRPNAKGGITDQAWRRIWGYEWRHNEGGEHDRRNPLVQMFSRMPNQAGMAVGKNIVKAGVFDGGGVLPPGGIGFNLSRKPEAVHTIDQLRERDSGRRGPAVEFSGDIHIHDGTDLDRLMKRASFEARASGFGGV